MDQLADGRFPFAGVLFSVKVFRDHHFGGEQGPRFGHLDIFLFENNLAAIVGNFSRALLPFDLVERFDLRIAKNPFDRQRFCRSRQGGTGAGRGGVRGTPATRSWRRRRQMGTSVNHGKSFFDVCLNYTNKKLSSHPPFWSRSGLTPPTACPI